MATLQSKLIMSLVDRVTAPARGIAATMKSLTSAQKRNAAQLSAMNSQMLGAVGAGYALARGISAPIKSAMEFESAMADVRKVVDFPTPEGFANMRKDILDLSTTLPIAATGIADIVAAAGQAGMKGNELLEFTNVAAKVGVAFDMAAGETGTALAKMKTALGLSVADVSLLADAINHLSNTSASSAPDILNFMRRSASFGAQYGFTATQTAAIGSAMIAAGFDANVAATSFQNVGRALTKGASATKRQKGAYKTLGLDAKKVAKEMQKDAAGTLEMVLERIQKVPKEARAALVSDLFGNEAKAISTLVNRMDLYKDAIAAVDTQAKFLGSSQKEYETRAATTANAMQLFKNQAVAASIAIGEALLPAINGVMKTLAPVLKDIRDLAIAHPKLTQAIVATAAGLVALRVAAIAAQFSLLWMKGGFIAGAKGISRLAGQFGKLRNAIMAAQIASAIGGGGGFTAMLAGMAAPLAAMKAAAVGVGGLIMGITWPVWALVAAVAAVGLAIYNYWVPIKEFVSGFASVLSTEIGNAVSAVASFGADVASAVGAWALEGLIDIGSMLGIDEATVRAVIDGTIAAIISFKNSVVSIVSSIAGSIGDWFSDIFSMNEYSATATAEFRSAGEQAATAMINAVKAIPGAIIDLFRGLGSKIASAIGRINWSSLVPNWVTNLMGSGSGTPIAGARAAGGSISGGKTYLVGEEGPELVTPGSSGHVHNAGKTAGMLGGGGKATASPINLSVTQNITGGSDAEEVAQKAISILGDGLKDLVSGIQADMEWT